MCFLSANTHVVQVKPVLSDHIKQEIFLAFQTGGCLLLYESSAESSCMSFLYYFHSAISNKLMHELSVLLSFSNKQPPVNSNFHVT